MGFGWRRPPNLFYEFGTIYVARRPGMVSNINIGSLMETKMDNYRYFAGDVQLKNVCIRPSTTAERVLGTGTLMGIDPAKPPVFVQGEGWTGYVKVERSIRYKSNPSRHECDARCVNATGRVMNCECSCGGKNHGKGAFKCA
jgi:hypothetical protein